jgi:heme a synthase
MMDAIQKKLKPPSPWLHRVAVVLACSVFALIWVRGLAANFNTGMIFTGSSEPTGWNLWVERADLLLGAWVGLVTIGLVGCVWMCESRRWIRLIALGAFVLALLQGYLGWGRLLLDHRLIAMLHDWCVQAFFSMAVALAMATAPSWYARPTGDLKALNPAITSRFSRWILFTCLLVALQILLGAWLRNIAWYDSVWLLRAVLWMHLVVAAAIFVHALLLLVTAGRGGAGMKAFRRQAGWLTLMVSVQIGLGCGTWVVNYSWPGWMGRFQFAAQHIIAEGSTSQSLTTTTHVSVGTLVLAVTIQTAMCWFRLQQVQGKQRKQ